jgi:hypothetical protein
LRDIAYRLTGNVSLGYMVVFALEIAGLVAALLLFRTISVENFQRDAQVDRGRRVGAGRRLTPAGGRQHTAWYPLAQFITNGDERDRFPCPGDVQRAGARCKAGLRPVETTPWSQVRERQRLRRVVDFGCARYRAAVLSRRTRQRRCGHDRLKASSAAGAKRGGTTMRRYALVHREWTGAFFIGDLDD